MENNEPVKQWEEPWKLEIERVNNGYILTFTDWTTGRIQKHTIEDNHTDELQAHEQLLFEVADFFAFFGSKHDNERIKISREKQEA